jgi:ABC-type branched-subunit amino acid transport system ATPase component/ABC-type branched-subunit amino acid transport system permease subunit
MTRIRSDALPLAVAALTLVLLPFILDVVGLPLRSAVDVVVYAIACMGLNILVGYTGLVSFGHGAWFGLGAYGAALSQRYWFAGGVILPALFAIIFVAAAALLSGALILRRRGVYFSLLTLALTALLFAIGYRWTEVTGGESGLGGVTRSAVLGLDLEQDWSFYWVVALVAMAVCTLLWRFHRSPVGSVLVAIRENEERARFIGYPTNRYKLMAFVLSAVVVAVAGAVSVFNHRFASAEPLSVAFSGELIAMVVIGGMRSFLGPALGALFFILFREFLSIWTPHWLFWFGLLFVGFIVFSPTGLVGVAGRLLAPFRARVIEAAAMAGRSIVTEATLPPLYCRPASSAAPVLVAQGLVKRFGGIHAVDGVTLAVRDRTLHALIGPNGAGKTTAFNLLCGLYPPDGGTIELEGRSISGLKPEHITAAGVGRSFQITNLFAGLSVQENVRLAVQARHDKRFVAWRSTTALTEVDAETAEVMAFIGLSGMEHAQAASLSYGGARLLDLGVALATRPRILLLDEPLAGLAVAERARVATLVETIAAEIPVLLVEHDIDRVFQIADHITVMNEGKVLVDGTVEDARRNAKVGEVYIGSGTAVLAAKPRVSAAQATPLLVVDKIDTFYGKSHILNSVSLEVREHEIVALLGRNGAGKSTLLKTLIGIAAPQAGSIRLAGEDTARLASAEIARRGIGYVPQGRGLFAGMTVADNLALGRLKRLTGAGVHWDDQRIVTFFPRLAQRWRTPADYLSGGEQQMAAIARALAGDVRVLLLDEPFEGLSPAVTEELFEAFDRMRHEIAMIIVDHHLDLALALSDRTVVLERGAVSWTGASHTLKGDLALRRQVLWM